METKFLTKSLWTLAVCLTVFGLGIARVWALPEPYLLGDLNADQHIGIADLAILSENWLGLDCQNSGLCNGTDIDSSGKVNMVDLVYFSANWGSLAAVSGVDLFETVDANINLNIPADFFEPGSDPFQGNVVLRGVKLETYGPFEMGTTDGAISRRVNTLISPDNAETVIPITFVNVLQRSETPIEIHSIPESTSYWWLEVTRYPESSPSQTGTMTLYQDGSCDINVPVIFKLTFTNASDPEQVREMVLDEMKLLGTGGTWTPIAQSPAADLSVPRLNAAFGLSIELASDDYYINLQPPVPDTNRPGHYVSPGAYVDPNVASLGRYSQILNGAHIGQDVVIGPNTVIDQNAIIEKGSVIGSNAYIGQNVHISPHSIVGCYSTVGDFTKMKPRCYIGPNSTIGADCNIGSGVDLGNNTFIGDNAVIGNSVKGGSNLWIGGHSTVAEGLRLNRGGHVNSYTTLIYDLVPCSEPLSGNYVGTGYQCDAAGGVVSKAMHITDRTTTLLIVPTSGRAALQKTEANEADPNAGWVKKLTTDMNSLVDPCEPFGPNMPIHQWPWEPNSRDCDDYAGATEHALSDMNDYDANDTTFTAILVYEKVEHQVYRPVWFGGGLIILEGVYYTWEITFAHGKTDVHKDGKTVWVEPQNCTVNTDMDVDGDGKVEYLDSPETDDYLNTPLEDQFTEGDKNGNKAATIFVWDSREEAESQGWSFD